ncbi:MAG: hypothetical protein M5R40_15110 [Anaerolineae bacterium]|nr:hypothetical protein [Anaerolineae bacterium]
MFQPRAAFIDSDAFQDDPVLPFFLEQMAASFYPARVPAWTQIAEALAQGRARVIVGDESVETMLRVVQAEVADLVARALLAAEG